MHATAIEDTEVQARSSDLSAPSAASGDTTADLIASLKRRISELEAELNKASDVQSKKIKTGDDRPFVTTGRFIRRLVSLTDRVEDLVAEADRRGCLDDPDASCSEDEDRRYSAYKQLVQWKPSLGRLFSSHDNIVSLTGVFRDLNEGADSARGDDAASLKSAVINWLKECYPAIGEGLDPERKTGRGLDHILTGRLLCPVDYDWKDDQQRAAIRSVHPDFLVTADSWPMFLYEGETYDPQDPSKGLFRSALMLKTFKHIFTSPSSAFKTDILAKAETQDKGPRKVDECRTRAHVAAKIGMTSVSPRAIAYIAVQLRFVLSNCGSWRITDGDFNHFHFYNNILAFFEQTQTPDEKKFIQELLFWWNRNVFGRENVSIYRPRNTKKLSVAMSLSKGRKIVSTGNTA